MCVGPSGRVLFTKFNNYMRFNFVASALPFMGSFVSNFFTGENSFDSQKWGGMVLQKVGRCCFIHSRFTPA